LTGFKTLQEAYLQIKDIESEGFYFVEGGESDFRLSYQDFSDKCLGVLGSLQRHGLHENQEVVIRIKDNQNFLLVFWACLLGRMIPIPISSNDLNDHIHKLLTVWKTLSKPTLISDENGIKAVRDYFVTSENNNEDMMTRTLIIEDLIKYTCEGKIQKAKPNDVAYIQYSSGSTGAPNGVVLTHENIITNVIAIIKRSKITKHDRMLSWLPLTHDMGLICFHLTGLCSRINQIILSTPSFIKRPLKWISKASDYEASLLYSPNFGYQYFLSSFNDSLNYYWNLSSVRIIYNGAEPISINLFERFFNKLKKFGLKTSAMYPGYGLAEACVVVTLPTFGDRIKAYDLNRNFLNPGQRIKVSKTRDNQTVNFVEVGEPVANCKVRISNMNEEELPDCVIGEIQIKGANVTHGYYNNLLASKNLFTNDRWLKTGDLGYITNKSLVVTGRVKNIIIVNGQNYYPQDIERIVEGLESFAIRKAIAVQARNNISKKAELVIFVLFKGPIQSFTALISPIKNAVRNGIGLHIDNVLSIRKIPQTTSGKIQYFKLKKQYQEGAFIRQITEIKRLMLYSDTNGLKYNFTSENLLKFCNEITAKQIENPKINLFEAGVDSIMVSKLASSLSLYTGITISQYEVFQNPTVEKLWNHVRNHSSENSFSIQPITNTKFYNLSPAQKRIWIVAQLGLTSTPYNITVANWINGNLNIGALESAINALIQRHESLRTSFTLVKGQPKQKIYDVKSYGYEFEYLDLRKAKHASRELGEITRVRSEKDFDLENGPLLRTSLIQMKDHQFLFMFVIHHINCDGWSFGLIFKEMRMLYNAFCNDENLTLTPLTIQLKDCVAWKRQQLNEGNKKLLKSFWLKELHEFSKLNLPTYQTRPIVQTYKGKCLEFSIQRDLSEGLKTLSQRRRVTLFTTLLSLINILLYKYTGQTEILLGINSAGRVHKDLENQIGYFLNTLCIRMQFAETLNFNKLLFLAKNKLTKALKYQMYPYENIIQDLGLESDLSRNPIFDVLVLMQNFNSDLSFENLSDELDIREFQIESRTSLMDLQFEFIENHYDLQLTISYNTDLFLQDQIERMGKHFLKLIQLVVLDSQKAICEYDILFEDERKKVLLDFNQKGNRTWAEKSIIGFFEEMIVQNSENIALIYDGKEVSYEKLNKDANRLSFFLQNQYNIKNGDRVGIMLERSDDLVTTILAVLKLGAIFIPIDTSYPDDRVSFIAEDSNLKVLICYQSITRSNILGDRVQSIDQALKASVSYSSSNPQVELNEDIAYIMYTSGTTGKPKGVLIRHESLCDYALTFINHFNISSQDIMVQQASISFDVMVEEIFPILIVGGKLVISGGANLDTHHLLDLMELNNVSIITTTPLVINELNKYSNRLKSLRVIISGGDSLRTSHIDNLFPEKRITNTYGPTESTVCATYHEIKSLPEINVIGRPIANRRVLILDSYLNPVPIGVTGEIFIGGSGVSKGYLNHPELTHTQFIKDPFFDGQILFRSGDLGCWRPDGSIEFKGRKDRQVKIAGYRVELAEIEAVISKYKWIKDVVVSKYTDQEKPSSLIAYLISDSTIDYNHLKLYLGEKLPFYMIPARLIQMNNFPLTKNGKIDKKAFPDKFEKPLPVNQVGIAKSGTEIRMIKLWEKTLEKPIGVWSNFFELGGHSLKAAILATNIEKEFNVKIGIKDIYIHSSIRALSDFISSASAVEYSSIKKIKKNRFYGITQGQKGIWLSSQLGNASIHVTSLALKFDGLLKVDFLRYSFKKLISRHETLRTTFLNVDGEIVQKIHPRIKQSDYIKLVDYRNTSDWKKRIRDIARSKSNLSFDLNKPPLFRCTIFRIEDRKSVVLFSIHGIIADGWSIEVILEELFTRYDFLCRNSNYKLPSLEIQYKDYVAWLKDNSHKKHSKFQRRYWIEQLKGDLPVTTFRSKDKTLTKSNNGAQLVFEVDRAAYLGLDGFCKDKGVSLFMTLLAALNALFFYYTKQTDIIIGTPISIRDNADLQNQIGYYLNLLPLRIKIDKHDRFFDLLEKVKRTTLDGIENRSYPFESIMDNFSVGKDGSKPPLFDIMIILQNVKSRDTDFLLSENYHIHPFRVMNKLSQFELTFDFVQKASSLELYIDYKIDLFKESFVRFLEERFMEVLKQILNNSNQRLENYDPFLDSEDPQKLTIDLNF